MISDNFHIVVEFHSIPFSSFSVFFLQVNSVVSWGSCFTHRLYLLHSIDPLVDSQENVKELRRPSVRKLVLLYISTVFLKLLITNSFLFLCKYWFHGLENAILESDQQGSFMHRVFYDQVLIASNIVHYSPWPCDQLLKAIFMNKCSNCYFLTQKQIHFYGLQENQDMGERGMKTALESKW